MKVDLEKQHGSLEQAIGCLEDSHVAAQREQESTARRARQSHDELASTRDENARRREELTKLEADVQNLKRSLEQERERVSKAQSGVELLREQRSATLSECSDRLEQVETLQQQHAAQERELDDLKSEVASAVGTTDQLRRELAPLHEAKDVLEKRRDALVETCRLCGDELGRERLDTEALSTIITHIQSDHEAIASEGESVRHAHASALESHGKLSALHLEVVATFDKLSALCSAVAAQVKRQTSELGQATKLVTRHRALAGAPTASPLDLGRAELGRYKAETVVIVKQAAAKKMEDGLETSALLRRRDDLQRELDHARQQTRWYAQQVADQMADEEQRELLAEEDLAESTRVRDELRARLSEHAALATARHDSRARLSDANQKLAAAKLEHERESKRVADELSALNEQLLDARSERDDRRHTEAALTRRLAQLEAQSNERGAAAAVEQNALREEIAQLRAARAEICFMTTETRERISSDMEAELARDAGSRARLAEKHERNTQLARELAANRIALEGLVRQEEHLRAECDARKSEGTWLQGLVSGHEEKLRVLRLELDDAVGKSATDAGTGATALTTARETAEDLRSRLDTARATLRQKQKHVISTQRSLDLAKERDTLLSQRKDEEAALLGLETTVRERAGALQQVLSRSAELETDESAAEAVKREHGQEQKRLAELEAQLAECDAKHAALEAKRARDATTLEHIEREQRDLENEIHSAQQRAGIRATGCDDLHKTIERERVVSAERQRALDTCIEDVRHANGERTECEAQCAELAALVAEERRRAEANSRELLAMKEQRAEREERLELKRAELTSQEEALADVGSSERLVEECNQLRAQLAAVRHQIRESEEGHLGGDAPSPSGMHRLAAEAEAEAVFSEILQQLKDELLAVSGERRRLQSAVSESQQAASHAYYLMEDARDLHEQVRLAEAEHARATARAADAKRQESSLGDEGDEASQELSRDCELAQATEEELERVREELALETARAEQMERDTVASRARRDEAITAAEQTEMRLSGVMHETSRLERTLAQITAVRSGHTGRDGSLVESESRRELAECQRELASLELARDEALGAVRKLEGELTRCTTELETEEVARQREASALAAELERDAAEIKALKREDRRSQGSELAAELERDAAKHAREQLADLKSEFSGVMNRVACSLSDRRLVDSELHVLRDETRASKDRNAVLATQLSLYEDQLRVARDELAVYRALPVYRDL